MTEQEIDVRRYWSALTARWWLPLLGLFGGALLAYALSLGGSDVWRGQAIVYLGQPVTPGFSQVQSLGTNPSTAAEIATADAVQRRVEREAGMRRGDLSGNVSVAAVEGSVPRLGQNPLVRVRVDGDSRRVARAATLLAREIVAEVSDYANAKIEILEQGLADGERELGQLDVQLDRASPGTERAFLFVRRGELRRDLLNTRQTLALAERVERARVVEEALARKVTAQSRRNQVVVGAVLGLLLGIAAALAWEAATAVRRR